MRNALALAVTFLFAAPAFAEDALRPRVVLTWETRDAGAVSSSSLRQDIDVYLSRAISDTISLRMNVGANRYRLATEVPDLARQETRALELRPSGSLLASFGRVTTETDYALRRTRTDSGERPYRRNDEQMVTLIGWGASKLIPGGSVRASRYRLTDRAASAEIVNDSMSGTLNYALGPFGVSAGQSYRADRDSRGAYERKTTDRNANLTFADTWLGGKLAVSAGASGTQSRIDDAAGRVSRIPTFVPPGRAFWGVDDTPLDSSDHPLSAWPSLIDSRISVSTGISLGPDAPSFQAIAFDIGRVSPVDEIQIVVRDDRLDPVRNPAGIDWDVYTSLDGVRWTPHTGGLHTTFDSVRSLYQIAFEQVDVRWIKVVTFGVAAQPVFVTEALVLYHIERESGGNDSEFRSLASSASIILTPIRSVTLSYTGASYESRQESGESLQSDLRDITHLVSLRYDPTTRFGYEARYELQQAETDRIRQEMRSILGSIRYTPRPQFSAMLSCDLREETFDGTRIDGRACAATVSARLFPTLDVTGGASQRMQTMQPRGKLTTRSLFAAANTRLTSTLRLTLTATANRSSVDDWTGFAPPPSADDRITADIDWIRGRALGIGGTFGWARGDSFSGLVQRYRLRWSPFGDGSVSLTTNYTQDIDPYSNSRSRRLLFSPRWQVNSQAALSLTWSSVSTTGQQSFESESILAALILGR